MSKRKYCSGVQCWRKRLDLNQHTIIMVTKRLATSCLTELGLLFHLVILFDLVKTLSPREGIKPESAVAVGLEPTIGSSPTTRFQDELLIRPGNHHLSLYCTNFGWSKMSDLNRNSCSQSRRVARLHYILDKLVGITGLEPARLVAGDSKSPMSAYSIISPFNIRFTWHLRVIDAPKSN